MTQKTSENPSITHRKLVRDRIPEIIRKHGKEPVTRILGKEEFRKAVGDKILEEAYELYCQWKKGTERGFSGNLRMSSKSSSLRLNCKVPI